MRKSIAVLLCCSVTLLIGCEALFGVKPDGTVQPGGGILGAVGSIASSLFPGPGTLIAGVIGAATTVAAALRGRNWKVAAVESFKVIEAGASLGKSVQEIKTDLKKAHEEAGGNVIKLVKGVVDKFGHTKSEPKKA